MGARNVAVLAALEVLSGFRFLLLLPDMSILYAPDVTPPKGGWGVAIQVVIVAGFHLFPFRTEKLSPPAPMVLHTRGRVGSRRFSEREAFERNPEGFFHFNLFT